MTIKKFKILSLDVWGNESEGFEVNDVRTIGHIEIDLDASNNDIKKQVFKHLENTGYLTFHAPYSPETASKESEINFLDDCYAEINEKSNGFPMYQLISEERT